MSKTTSQSYGPDSAVLLGWMLALAIGYGLALLINDAITQPLVGVKEDLSAFAAFYIVAQALERFLEPVSRWINAQTVAQTKRSLKDARERKSAARASMRTALGLDLSRLSAEQADPFVAAPSNEAQARADEQQAETTLDRIRANRAVGFWAGASILAFLVSATLGLYLLQAVAVAVDNPPGWLNAFDVLVTGLVIGAGTKPLHDLIARIEKSKENADPATQPRAGD